MEQKPAKPVNPYLSIVMFLGLIGLLWFMMSGGFGMYGKTVEPYTEKDVFYALETSDVVFDVKVDDVRKEKGKEHLYKLTFENMLDKYVRLNMELKASDYERIVGEGNNTVSGKMYTLTYVVPKKGYYHRGEANKYVLQISRFTCFAQIPFSKGEVNAYASFLIDYANEVLSGEGAVLDKELIKAQTNSEQVELTSYLDADVIAELQELPAEDPAYTDTPIIDDPEIQINPQMLDGAEDTNLDSGEVEVCVADVPWYVKVLRWFIRNPVVLL